MKFATKAHKDCYERIRPWIEELFGELALRRKDAPGFAIMVGSAIAHVVVFPWGDDEAVINTRAFVVSECEVKPDLMLYLLRQNAEMTFGAFGLTEEGDVVLDHSIEGMTANKEALRASVLAVILAADRFDDLIVERWGGRRALDRED